MTWLDSVSGLTPRLRGGVTLAGLIGGTGCIAIGSAINNSPMPAVGYAALCGAWLFYRLMGYCDARAHVEVSRKPDNEQAVINTGLVSLAIECEIDGGSMVWIEPAQRRVH
jgi:hypothetical protein